MFFSDLFKKNFVKHEKLAKYYVCHIDANVVKDLLESTKLIKANNMYSISSIRVCVILCLGYVYLTATHT